MSCGILLQSHKNLTQFYSIIIISGGNCDILQVPARIVIHGFTCYKTSIIIPLVLWSRKFYRIQPSFSPVMHISVKYNIQLNIKSHTIVEFR